MPGLYERRDSLSNELKRKRVTYNFTSIDRNNTAGLVTGMMDTVGQILIIFEIICILIMELFFRFCLNRDLFANSKVLDNQRLTE